VRDEGRLIDRMREVSNSDAVSSRRAPQGPIPACRAARAQRLLAAPLGLLAALLWLALPASAQVTNLLDEPNDDPLPEGSLREQVENTGTGSRIPFEVPAEEIEFVGDGIELREVLRFTRTVTLQNANEEWETVPVFAPPSGNLFEIADGVTLTLEDIDLGLDSTNPNESILLEGVDSVLIFDNTRRGQILDLPITGTGRVVKRGDLTLTLNGLNTFTGGLRIEAGEVKGDSLGLPNDITLAPGGSGQTATVTFDVALPGFPTTNISLDPSSGGRGIFVKQGTGSLNTFLMTIDPAIDFEIRGGTLQTNAIIRNSNVRIESAGTLEFFIPERTDLFSTVSGGGTILWNHATDRLNLLGDLSAFTGNLDLAAGESALINLFDVNPSYGFSVAIGSGSVFATEGPSDVLFTGNLSGDGAFEVRGSGTTTLTGVTSHTGGTRVLGGSLVGNTGNLQGTIDVDSGATLVFDQGSNGTFSGAIQDMGGGPIEVHKIGGAVLTLGTGANVSFNGDFFVDAGSLFMESGAGFAATSVRVGDGISAQTAALGAQFDPNASIAANTRNIGGGLDFRSNGQLVVGANDGVLSGIATNSLFTAGAVTIDPAAELVVQLQPGAYAPGTSFTFLTGSSITGAGFDVRQDYLLLDLIGTVQNGNQYVVTVQNAVGPGASFEGAADTGNRRAVGQGLDDLVAIGPGVSPEVDEALANLRTLRVDELAQTYDTLSGDDLAAMTNVRLAAAARTWRSLSERVALSRRNAIGHKNVRIERRRARRRALRDASEAYRAGDRQPPAVDAGPAREMTERPWVAWLDAGGVFGELESSNTQDIDYTLYGPLLGTDTALNDEVRIGFATAYTRSTYSSEQPGGRGSADGVEGVMYGAYVAHPWQALVAARYGHSWIETRRRIQFSGINDKTSADFEGEEYGLFAEGSWAWGEPGRWEIAPLASLAWNRVEFEDFNEKGSSAFRLKVDSRSIHSLASSIGFRASMEAEMDDGVMFRPRLKATWGHEWGKVERTVPSRFSAGNQSFGVDGVEIPRDQAELSVGWEMGYGEHANLFLYWDGRYGQDLIENAVSAGMRWSW